MHTLSEAQAVIEKLSDAELYAAAPLPDSLKLGSEEHLSVYYAPFDYVNKQARVVIVGITPGRVQAVNAIREARSALLRGNSLEEAQRAAKRVGSFSGPLRNNLVRLLDFVGVNAWLGLNSTLELFGKADHLVHFTSALQFPVFADDRNYTGRSPRILRSAFLRDQLERYLPRQLQALPEAIYVPLGDVVVEALDHLGSRGLIDRERILPGLVHPSGANAERVAYFVGGKRRERLSAKTDAARIDTGRQAALEFVRRLGASSRGRTAAGPADGDLRV